MFSFIIWLTATRVRRLKNATRWRSTRDQLSSSVSLIWFVLPYSLPWVKCSCLVSLKWGCFSDQNWFGLAFNNAIWFSVWTQMKKSNDQIFLLLSSVKKTNFLWQFLILFFKHFKELPWEGFIPLKKKHWTNYVCMFCRILSTVKNLSVAVLDFKELLWKGSFSISRSSGD